MEAECHAAVFGTVETDRETPDVIKEFQIPANTLFTFLKHKEKIVNVNPVCDKKCSTWDVLTHVTKIKL